MQDRTTYAGPNKITSSSVYTVTLYIVIRSAGVLEVILDFRPYHSFPKAVFISVSSILTIVVCATPELSGVSMVCIIDHTNERYIQKHQYSQ